jgi:6,7-dimethyl-8-ribityllumazine synthase
MATIYHNLSEYDFNSVPDASNMKFGIIVSEWNNNITGKLLSGAINTLEKHGTKRENILVKTVPGSFELTYGANQMIQQNKFDAVIILGCVVKGDTPHFDYVCQGVTQGITHLNATTNTPVIYGLITTNNMQQAEDRCGGKLGNKGDECAITAIKMIDFVWSLK